MKPFFHIPKKRLGKIGMNLQRSNALLRQDHQDRLPRTMSTWIWKYLQGERFYSLSVQPVGTNK